VYEGVRWVGMFFKAKIFHERSNELRRKESNLNEIRSSKRSISLEVNYAEYLVVLATKLGILLLEEEAAVVGSHGIQYIIRIMNKVHRFPIKFVFVVHDFD
jgi:hypothetical protein